MAQQSPSPSTAQPSSQVYGFDAAGVARLVAAVKRLEALYYNGPGRRGFTDPSTGLVAAVAPAGGIPAGSSTQLGKATCTLQVFSSTGAVTNLTQTIDVYNRSTTAVKANANIVIGRVGGLWMALWEDC